MKLQINTVCLQDPYMELFSQHMIVGNTVLLMQHGVNNCHLICMNDPRGS